MTRYKDIVTIIIRNVKRLILILVVLICQHSTTYATTDTDSPQLRVVSERLKPLVYINPETNEIEGKAAQMVKDMLAESRVTYSVEMLPWTRAFYIAQNEPNVLIFMIARTDEREKNFIWLHHYFTLNFYLYALESRKEELGKAEIDFKQARIGVIRNDFTHTELENLGYTNLIAVDDDRSLSQMLIRGRVDFVTSSGFGMNNFELGLLLRDTEIFEAFALPLQSIPVYFALSKNTDPDIVTKLNLALGSLDNIDQYHLPAVRSH